MAYFISIRLYNVRRLCGDRPIILVLKNVEGKNNYNLYI